MKNWIICTGRGSDYYGAYDTLEEAFAAVRDELVRSRDNCRVCFEANLDEAGLPRHFSWDALIRGMTDAEIDAAFDTDKLRRHHKKHRTCRTADWEATEKYVEFIGERVQCVSVTHVEWERDYLARAAMANDNRARRAEFDDLIA